MAFSIKKYNRGGEFAINTTGLEYFTLKELYDGIPTTDTTYVVGALYINTKSKFGDSPVAVVMRNDEVNGEEIPGFCVNLPRHLVEDVREILSSDEAVEAINARKVGFTVRKYYSKAYERDNFSITWVDL